MFHESGTWFGFAFLPGAERSRRQGPRDVSVRVDHERLDAILIFLGRAHFSIRVTQDSM